MKKYLLGILLFLSACNTLTTLPQQISVLDENETLGARDDSSFPIQAAKYVSLHADRSLRLNSTCTQVLRLNLVQKKGYKDTITELKNRAVLMGGNSVSLLSWREQDSRTILLGNIYMCKGKSFHLHPHPQV